MGGTTVVGHVDYDESLNRHRLLLSRDGDIRLLFSNRRFVVEIDDDNKPVWRGLGEAWLVHERRRTYTGGIRFLPSGPCPPEVFNLYRGFGIEPREGPWDLIHTHLLDVICAGDQANYDWLLRWLARCVQQPGEQAESAVVLRGEEGSGKSMLGQLMAVIFGSHFFQISQARHLVGNFNSHLLDVLFLFADEVDFAGHHGAGTLKSLITDDMMTIEPKGLPAFLVRNRLKPMISSNSTWVVPVSVEARRFFILDVPNSKKGQPGYFHALAAAIKGPEAPAFLHHLLGLDLTDFDHRNPPHTKALNVQKMLSSNSFQKYWNDCLHAGVLLGVEEGDGTTIGEWPEAVIKQDLHEAYVDHASRHGDRTPMTLEAMGKELRKVMPVDSGLQTIRPRDERLGAPGRRMYALPGLDECRRGFHEAMKVGSDLEWETDP